MERGLGGTQFGVVVVVVGGGVGVASIPTNTTTPTTVAAAGAGGAIPAGGGEALSEVARKVPARVSQAGRLALLGGLGGGRLLRHLPMVAGNTMTEKQRT